MKKRIYGRIIIGIGIILLGIAYIWAREDQYKQDRETYQTYVDNTTKLERSIHDQVPESKNDVALCNDIVKFVKQHRNIIKATSILNDSLIITLEFYPQIKITKNEFYEST